MATDSISTHCLDTSRCLEISIEDNDLSSIQSLRANVTRECNGLSASVTREWNSFLQESNSFLQAMSRNLSGIRSEIKDFLVTPDPSTIYNWGNLRTGAVGPLSSAEEKLMLFSGVSMAVALVAIGLIAAFPYTWVILLIIAASVGFASCVSTGTLLYVMKYSGDYLMKNSDDPNDEGDICISGDDDEISDSSNQKPGTGSGFIEYFKNIRGARWFHRPENIVE